MKQLSIIFIALFIFSCSPTTQKEEKKDNKMQPSKDDLLVRNDFTNTNFHEVPKRNFPSDLPTKPKNIIFMVGDGMGIAQAYAGYAANKKQLNLFQFPYTGFSITYSFDKFITDSAAGATAFATGKKSYNGAIAVDADTIPQKTILESAEENGLATGLIATCRITHATPACFIAHEPNRNLYEEIAADFLNTDVDVFIGGGYDDFAKRKDGKNLVEQLTNNGYEVITDVADLDAAGNGKIAGLLYPEHAPKISEGRGDMLEKATQKALDVVTQNDKGFFMMIEGSQIDWGGHANETGYIVQEMLDFDEVVGKVLDFAIADGETLVVVTADHETGGFSLTGGDFEKGYVQGSFTTGNHTGVTVPVYAFGPGAEKFAGIQENTDLYTKMMDALSLEK